MFVGVAEIVVFIPHSGSLKAKRSVVNSLRDRIRSRFRAAVSEIDDHDLWQRARVGVAVVGGDPGVLEETLRSIRRLAESVKDGRIIDYHQDGGPWSFED